MQALQATDPYTPPSRLRLLNGPFEDLRRKVTTPVGWVGDPDGVER
jgi:hypothetical protein